MNTKITLSEEISTKIIMVDKDANDDLSRHYLDFDIVVVDNFMSHEEIMILQDSQISNSKNSDIGKEHKMAEIIDNPSKLFRNKLAGGVLRDLKHRLSQFSLDKYESFSENIVLQYFNGELLSSEPDRANISFRPVIKHEDMHLDRYLLEPLRMFVNLDDQPRVWRTSYNQLEGMALMAKQRYFGTPKDLDIAKQTSKRGKYKDGLNGKINSQVLYDYQKKKNKSPYHELEFAPGAMWIMNSKRVSHQVVKGNRLATFSRFYPILQVTQEYLPQA
tara:strand:- start:975 stop:1799 length:825 start_codon:yes stop_codon:yes gene_type:complete